MRDALTRATRSPHSELGLALEPWLDNPFNESRFRVEDITQEEVINWAQQYLD